jgi:hypothetical protein
LEVKSILLATYSLSVLLGSGVACAATQGGDFERAKSLYYRAVDGDADALRQAAKAMDEFGSTTPRDPAVLAYTGSIRLLEAQKTLAIWRKGRLSKEGLSLLDEAVGLAPEDLEVRFVRAASTFHLPDFFHRREQSQKDFEWLAPRVSAAVAARALSQRLGSAALYHHGSYRIQAGDRSGARTAWEEAVRIGGDTRAAADAKERLKDLR